MNILVIGSQGTTGREIVAAIKARGHTVREFDRKNGFNQCTEGHFNCILNATHGCSAVIYAAYPSPDETPHEQMKHLVNVIKADEAAAKRQLPFYYFECGYEHPMVQLIEVIIPRAMYGGVVAGINAGFIWASGTVTEKVDRIINALSVKHVPAHLHDHEPVSACPAPCRSIVEGNPAAG